MKKNLRRSIFFLLLLLAGSFVCAQTRIVRGIVTSKDNGEPMPGVSVVVKGTSFGTETSEQGKFLLRLTAGANTLVFSYIGYQTVEFPVDTGNNIHIILIPELKQLIDVVVTGTGVATRKARLGISVETVSGTDLAETPQGTIDEGLIGKIPGAQISSVDGTPGATTNIVLRGINTVQGSTSPMILVDGVESGSLDIGSLDPAAVDHIEVVQGAAASTIYGAQGANGVIQIFTKKGQLGKTKVDIASSVSASTYLNISDVHEAHLSSYATNANGKFINSNGDVITLDPYGTYQGVNWAYGADANNPTAMSNPLNIAHQQYGTNLKYYDHFAQLFKTADNYNNSVAISGANNSSDYSFDISNNHQESNIRNNGYTDRTNLTTNLGIELFKGFTVRSITQLVYTKSTINPFFTQGRNNIGAAIMSAPFDNFDQKLPDGTYPGVLGALPGADAGFNPNYVTEYSNAIVNRVTILENIQADYRINKFIDLNAKYGISYGKGEETVIFQNQTENINTTQYSSWIAFYNGNDATGEIDNYNFNNTFQNFIASAVIKTDFKKDFHLNAPIMTSTLIEFDHRKSYDTQLFAYGIGLPIYPIYNFQQTTSQSVFSDQKIPFVTYGYVVNQKIDFGEYGGLAGGFRSDYSSAFGEGSKPFTFPDINAYIRPSSFNFWSKQKLTNIIPEFKLRAAYGEAGIQPGAFDRYPTLIPSNVGSSLVFSLPPAENNANLNVEVSKEFEAGTDIEIKGWSGSWLTDINLSGTYWTRKSSNVIFGISVAPSTGGTTIKTNAIDLASHGVQASATITVYRAKDFNWNFTTNFSNETSEITKVAGPPIILTSGAGDTQEELVAGRKIGQIYGYKALTSLSEKNQEGVPYILPANYGQYTMVDGRVVNIATKGIQFTNELYPLGDPNPKFNTSFINRFDYKTLSFGFQFDWVYGSHLYNQTKEWQYRDGISEDYDKPVDIAGTTAAYTAYYRSAYADVFDARNGGRNGTKDYFYEDASFLRLRNIYIGYDFSKLLNSKVFKRALLTLSGRNILTFTKYTGFDPEVSSGTSNSTFDRGVDDQSMPNIKSYQLGMNLAF